jgi:hypothetical protein
MMKKQLRYLLWIGMSLSLWSCELLDCEEEDASRTTKTTFNLITTVPNEAGDFLGPFTAKGDPNASGTFIMTITPVENTDSIHCAQTLEVPSVGTLTIISDCSMATNTGDWYIESGTGAYANLKGKGSLVMTTIAAGDVELMYGETWRQ